MASKNVPKNQDPRVSFADELAELCLQLDKILALAELADENKNPALAGIAMMLKTPHDLACQLALEARELELAASDAKKEE